MVNIQILIAFLKLLNVKVINQIGALPTIIIIILKV